MEYNATLEKHSPHNIDPNLSTYIHSRPDPNAHERIRHLTHARPFPTAHQATSNPQIPPAWPASSSQPRQTSTHQPVQNATTLSTKPPTSFLVSQPAMVSATAPQSALKPRYPPFFVPAQQQSIAPQSRPLAISSKPTSFFPPASNSGRVLHTLLPPAKHIVRADTPIRPFILSLPLGTPFHKRYKALLFFTRTHGTIVQSTFLAGPYFSYRDPANNRTHFLINDIMVPEGRWADELSYKVQVLESGLGLLDKDKRTWGNYWRETKEEKEGVVAFEGESERNVVLFWYGDGDIGEDVPEMEDDIGEEGRRLLEEGVWQWVN